MLSLVAAILACIGALISFALGFLILGEDLAGVVPTHWVIAFFASSIGAVVLLLVAVVSGRRALGLRGWRSSGDTRFFWETILGLGAAVAFGVASALSAGFPAYVFLAAILAAYVTLVRWTWWTWRGFR